MKMPIIQLASLLLLTASGAAQASSDAVKFPTKLVCQFTSPSSANAQETQILYTRLDAIKSLSDIPAQGKQVWSDESNTDRPKADEAAAAPWAGGYYSAEINAKTYAYSAWSCDSEDRYYTFKTADLAMPATSDAKTKSVTGAVRIEVREDGATSALTCEASY